MCIVIPAVLFNSSVFPRFSLLIFNIVITFLGREKNMQLLAIYRTYRTLLMLVTHKISITLIMRLKINFIKMVI